MPGRTVSTGYERCHDYTGRELMLQPETQAATQDDLFVNICLLMIQLYSRTVQAVQKFTISLADISSVNKTILMVHKIGKTSLKIVNEWLIYNSVWVYAVYSINLLLHIIRE